ncbi:MAG: DUF2254 domain-containing protein [Desulfopila sp.]
MKTRIINIWQASKVSFWTIPALMVSLAVLVSLLMVGLDREVYLRNDPLPSFLTAVGPEGARALLSTIAGSMITVAGVTFSITIVALNLASTQFGPRLLRNFMQDRGIQFVLGTYVSNFLYCLLVLRSIQTIGPEVFVPNFSVLLAMVMAFLGVGVLIFFIHHISTSIQADRVIVQVSTEMRRNIEHLFPHEIEDASGDLTRKIAALQKENVAHQRQMTVASRADGYLQAIDHEGLLQLARDKDFFIEIRLRPGNCVVSGSPMAIVSSAGECTPADVRAIAAAFIVGQQRTPEQDAEFSINQLVEIALRALSPGINDPFTAMVCIDQLGSVLCYLAVRKFPPASRFDDHGFLRLQIQPYSFPGMVNAAFDQIRQCSCGNIAVTIRLLETLTMIAERTHRPARHAAIRRQADMIVTASGKRDPSGEDEKDIRQRYDILCERIQIPADETGDDQQRTAAA